MLSFDPTILLLCLGGACLKSLACSVPGDRRARDPQAGKVAQVGQRSSERDGGRQLGFLGRGAGDDKMALYTTLRAILILDRVARRCCRTRA